MNLFPIHIQPFNEWLKLQEIITLLGFENSQMDVKGCVSLWEGFLKELQVTDKIIDWIFFQFTFNLLQMNQTQEITTFSWGSSLIMVIYAN